MVCPACEQELPNDIQTVRTLAVCPSCAHSLVIADGTARIATAEDTLSLTAGEQTQLRKMRPTHWRDGVKAQMQAIRGRAR